MREHIRDGVRALQRGDDAFQTCQRFESLQRLRVRHRDILRAPAGFQMCVLGTHARIIQPCRDRVRGCDLAVLKQ